MCRQSTKLLQLSKKLCTPRRNQQGIEKFLKVHRSLVYLLKTVLNQNQDIGEADVTPARKHHKIFSLRHGPVWSSQARATSCSPTSLRWDRVVNTRQYIEVLDTLMKSWMETVAGECPYVFQPGQSPAHTTKITQAFLKVNLKDHCPKEIWPPSSLD
jgi:hypothetical protein